MNTQQNDFCGSPLYLDNAATTPMDQRVIDCMTTIMQNDFGNPSSATHSFGRRAKDLVETARQQVATLIQASPTEIIFTSGATESCNLAIKGVAERYAHRGQHLIVSQAEHKAVLEPCRQLERQGYNVTWLKPDQFGTISAEQVASAIQNDTILACVMAANNVVGTLNPIKEIAKACKERDVLFFCDATQIIGKLPVSVEQDGIDLLAFSAHKFHGPKGIGALYVRRRGPRVSLSPIIHGGGQEGGLRSGTVNVPAVAGFGIACELADTNLASEADRLATLRQRFEVELTACIDGLKILGHPTNRAPHITNIAFRNIEAKTLLNTIPNLAASAGSACGTHDPNPNYVLRASGLSQDEAATAVRFSLGRFTTDAEIQHAVITLCDAYKKLQSYSSVLHLEANPLSVQCCSNGCSCNSDCKC